MAKRTALLVALIAGVVVAALVARSVERRADPERVNEVAESGAEVAEALPDAVEAEEAATNAAAVAAARNVVFLVGRAVDAEGAPIQTARLRVQWGDGSAVRSLPPSFTDQDGHFMCRLDGGLPLRVRGIASTNLRGRERSGGFEVGPLEAGTHEIGDVVFYPAIPPGPLVTGRCVDPDGAPVAARVELRWGSTFRTLRTEADGSFAVDGSTGSMASFRLHVFAEGFDESVATCEPGAELGDVVLTRLFALQGSLIVDPDWPLDSLHVLARRQPSIPGEPALRETAVVAPNCTFRLENMRSGVWDLYLTGPTWVGEIPRLVADISLRAGEEAPTLEPIDVRALVLTTEVSVRDASGGAMANLDAWRLLTRDQDRWIELSRLEARQGGRYVFLHGGDGGDVDLANPFGSERELVRCDGKPKTVVPEEQRHVWMRLAGHERLPRSGSLVVTFGESIVSLAHMADDGTIAIHAPFPGTWEVRIAWVTNHDRGPLPSMTLPIEFRSGRGLEATDFVLSEEFIEAVTRAEAARAR